MPSSRRQICTTAGAFCWVNWTRALTSAGTFQKQADCLVVAQVVQQRPFRCVRQE